ncbi:aminotransferase-like domain-containing protein [Deinococcus roseus]|uniref:2-aminoadipate aminotransferase n=1 Tax=Deinococcus roseus TaxID=392414 RepID=A0ABQ2CUI7_9DEIO|nr:PLP-dependent aminotransferase family protein [Deinococcus roseus]GGJ22042.1 2-aminoadipate aminotransferase [Deinococcus roseus]
MTASLVQWDQCFADRALRITSSTIRELLKLTQKPDIISFAGGLPAPELFPVQEVAAATQKVLTEQGAQALQYSTTEGHAPLRQWIAAQHGNVNPDNILLVSGSQQGLDLLGKILINPGDLIGVETPTYLGALQAFSPYEPEYVSIPTDEEGIDTTALEELLKQNKLKFIYAIPNFQNPTGRTMSLERRKKLVEITGRYGVLLLEDDPYGKLRFRGDFPPSLFSLGLEYAGGNEDQNHVIYMSTFSKTLTPGLRVAWVTANPTINRKLVQAKQGADLHTPTLNQMIVFELVHEVLGKQTELVRKVYGERRQFMMEALGKYLPAEVAHTDPEGGMFLWLTLPEHMKSTELLKQAVDYKVAFVPGTPFFALGGGENTLRLSYSCANAEQIDRGIKALGEVLHKNL